MSYLQNLPQIQQQLNLNIQEQIKMYEKGRTRAAWYNPCTSYSKDSTTGKMLEPETIYIGESRTGNPTWDEPVMHVPTYVSGIRTAATEGRAKNDKEAFNPWLGEWKDRQNEFLDSLKYKTAGVVTSDDFTAINVVNVLAELLGTQYLNHTLEQAVTRVNTPSLTLQIDTYTKFTAFQDVDEGIMVPTKKGTFTRQSMDLKKDVGNIAFTDEVLMRPLQHDIYQTHIENAVADLKRIKARKIAGVVESAAQVSGSDWAAMTGGISTAQPYDQIGGIVDTIISNTGIPDTIVSSDRPWRDFYANTWVKGTTAQVPNVNFGARILNAVDGLPGMTWYIDPELTNTQATIFDKKAVILAQGPVRTAQYRYEEAGIDGYLTRDWNAVKIVQSGFIRVLTGISA